MKLVSINQLKGGEISEYDVKVDDAKILSSGSIIKSDYIELLKELNLDYIYIKDIYELYEEKSCALDYKKEKEITEEVEENLEKYLHNNNSIISRIKSIALEIFEIIMSNKEELINKRFDFDEKNSDIYKHIVRVCEMSILIAIKLKLPEDEIKEIAIGSLLHDIGFRYINVKYENMNINELTPNEIFEYKKHTIYGYSSLENEKQISDYSKMIVLSHHERLDGSGYPLKQKNINIGSRIVAICDIFDSMISGIGCLHESIESSIEYIEKNKGILFDEKIVEVFMEIISKYPVGTILDTDNNEKCVVIKQTNYIDNPLVRIIDNDGNIIGDNKFFKYSK